MLRSPPPIRPVTRGERFEALDVLRGVAVLGILLMNVQSFSMPAATYSNPTVFGDFGGLGRWIWAAGHVFAAEKFLTLFALLFGAGVAVMSARAEQRGSPAAPLHYRRMLWLMLFGLAHAYFIWYGDILFSYAVCGLWVFLLRRQDARTLLVAGVCSFAVASAVGLLAGLSLPSWPAEQRHELLAEWRPAPETLEDEIAAYRSGWWRQMEHRLPQAVELQTVVLGLFVLWKAGGLMLIGMALVKLRILTGEASRQLYRRMVAVGFGAGFPLVLLGLWRHLAEGFRPEWSAFFGVQPNYWGSALVALGYAGAVCLLVRGGRLPRLTDRLSAVGRMALTNYLLQSVICTSIFYGHGFGLFGRLDRPGQLLVVLAVWAFQLETSLLWLRLFRFGPAEWLWRSLTYGRPQPLQIRPSSPAT